MEANLDYLNASYLRVRQARMRECPHTSETGDRRGNWRCDGCGRLRPMPAYCLHMDSGAAWHIINGENIGRCPTDGCKLGH
jgi:hypothetical protein